MENFNLTTKPYERRVCPLQTPRRPIYLRKSMEIGFRNDRRRVVRHWPVMRNAIYMENN